MPTLAEALSLATFVSFELVVTEATFVTVCGAFLLTPNFAVIVLTEPAGIVPRRHGNELVQSPLFERKIRPVGEGS
jgi:hypothetical protein